MNIICVKCTFIQVREAQKNTEKNKTKLNFKTMETKNITLFIESINYRITQLEKRNEILEIRRYKRILEIVWNNISK